MNEQCWNGGRGVGDDRDCGDGGSGVISGKGGSCCAKAAVPLPLMAIHS